MFSQEKNIWKLYSDINVTMVTSIQPLPVFIFPFLIKSREGPTLPHWCEVIIIIYSYDSDVKREQLTAQQGGLVLIWITCLFVCLFVLLLSWVLITSILQLQTKAPEIIVSRTSKKLDTSRLLLETITWLPRPRPGEPYL